jgi:Predicted nucleotide-binding protein containing TIR-like domain
MGNRMEEVDIRLSYPNFILVLLSRDYFQDYWLPQEFQVLLKLADYRGARLLFARAEQLGQIPRHIRQRMMREKQFDLFRGQEAMSELQSFLENEAKRKTIFIGHGRDHQWKSLKDHLTQDLKLACEYFEGATTEGELIPNRIHQLLVRADFAFIVMTAEIKYGGVLHPRENVVHEAGLFQARLGYERAIIVLEKGCELFSNNTGIKRIEFKKGQIEGCFTDVDKVLRREGVIS